MTLKKEEAKWRLTSRIPISYRIRPAVIQRIFGDRLRSLHVQVVFENLVFLLPTCIYPTSKYYPSKMRELVAALHLVLVNLSWFNPTLLAFATCLLRRATPLSTPISTIFALYSEHSLIHSIWSKTFNSYMSTSGQTSLASINPFQWGLVLSLALRNWFRSGSGQTLYSVELNISQFLVLATSLHIYWFWCPGRRAFWDTPLKEKDWCEAQEEHWKLLFMACVQIWY